MSGHCIHYPYNMFRLPDCLSTNIANLTRNSQISLLSAKQKVLTYMRLLTRPRVDRVSKSLPKFGANLCIKLCPQV